MSLPKFKVRLCWKQDFKTFGKNIGLCTLHNPHNGFLIDPIKNGTFDFGIKIGYVKKLHFHFFSHNDLLGEAGAATEHMFLTSTLMIGTVRVTPPKPLLNLKTLTRMRLKLTWGLTLIEEAKVQRVEASFHLALIAAKNVLFLYLVLCAHKTE